MEGRKQLPAEAIFKACQIASLRIHADRVIGRIKNYAILKSTLPISVARIANQIVCVCAWLVNFQPALIPPPVAENNEVEVEQFRNILFPDSAYDADLEESDEDDT